MPLTNLAPGGQICGREGVIHLHGEEMDANSGSSKNFMVCQASQLGGNEALGAEIAPVCGELIRLRVYQLLRRSYL
jgi:hypothetical protein